MKGEIDKAAIIVGDFNIPLSVINRSSRQKISKDVKDLNKTTNQLVIIDIYREIHPTTENTLSSIVNEIVTQKEQVMGHKTSHNTV